MLGLLNYDLILLDVMLPKLGGIDLCRRLQEHDRSLPIMLVTARDSVADKLMGLDSGADDYLVKPFDLQELLSRVPVLSRRFADRPMEVLTLGDIRLDPERRALTRNNRIVPFTRREYLPIELLSRYPRRIFSRSDIVDRLWPLENPPTEDTVKSHIRRIRHKLAGSTRRISSKRSTATATASIPRSPISRRARRGMAEYPIGRIRAGGDFGKSERLGAA
jgi:DNA-binding response OmpR family regulator